MLSRDLLSRRFDWNDTMLNWLQLSGRLWFTDSVYSHTSNRIYMGKSHSGLYHEAMFSWLLLSEWNHTNSMCNWKILSSGFIIRVGVPFGVLLFDAGDKCTMFYDGVWQRYMAISILFIDL
jgi:hypothetical protein